MPTAASILRPAARAMLHAGALAVALGACASVQVRAGAESGPAPQDSFWEGLQALCGNAFEGTVIHSPPGDSAFVGNRLLMHVASCTDEVIRIPFHVGADRSRTWVVTRMNGGLELKHIHRYEDGTESSNTNYGGTTGADGTAHRQEFPADAVSVAAVPGRATQFWFLELYPRYRFSYGLFRQATGLHYRIEFDLTRAIDPPPPAW
jgi:hypothetical protein